MTHGQLYVITFFSLLSIGGFQFNHNSRYTINKICVQHRLTSYIKHLTDNENANRNTRKKFTNSSATSLKKNLSVKLTRYQKGHGIQVFWGIDRGHCKSGRFITSYPYACIYQTETDIIIFLSHFFLSYMFDYKSIYKKKLETTLLCAPI